MLHFTNPWFLLLLLLAVPPVVWLWLRQRRGALRYSAVPLLTGLPAGRAKAARWGGAALRAAGLVLLIVAVSGPRWPDEGTRIPTQSVAIQMVVDVSGSMAERDFTWGAGKGDSPPNVTGTVPFSGSNRLDGVKTVFRLFVAGGDGPGPGKGDRTSKITGPVPFSGRPDDLIGLVTFATFPETACPLTLSHSVLLRLLDAEQPRAIPTESRTNIGDAVAWGLHKLAASPAKRKVMVLLSDGEHNVPPPALTPRQAAQLAASQSIPVYVIDVGGPGQVEAGKGDRTSKITGPVPFSGRPDIRASGVKSLQALADITGGRYFRARDAEALAAVCQEIDQLERTPVESFRYRRYYEGFAWLALASFVLFVGVYGLEMTLWRKLP